ncbi:MAG: enoyl-CoA hydratase-related protein [Phycisphaeraceae bacterium]
MSGDVLAAVRDGVLRVTLNRPEKRNPLSRAVLAQLREVFAAHRDAELSLALLRGAGDQSFAAGGDLRGLELLGAARVLSATQALAAGLVEAVAPEGEEFAAFVERWIAPFARQRPQVMRAFKAQAAAAKRGEPRAQSQARDAELFARAWCHADHWAAAENILSKEASR